MQSIDLLKAALRTQGYKMTRNRIGILDFLSTKNEPISADDIRLELESISPSINKTTVYRELLFLLEIGFVSEVEFGDGKKRYELSFNKPHHHHIICRQCKKVEDVPLEKDVENFKTSIENQTNFKLTDHMLEFFGLCGNCK